MRKIIFYHIPKTAGQSVRRYLEIGFRKKLMFPGYVDADLIVHSKRILNEYGIFAGHFSPALLDGLSGEVFRFTILRDPTSRIVSFYRHIRRYAMSLSDAQLALRANAVYAAARNLAFEKFLVGHDCDALTRRQILEGFNNVYTYMFGTRLQSGQGYLEFENPSQTYHVLAGLVNAAILNLSSDTNVYFFDNLSELASDLANEVGYSDASLGWSNRPDDAEGFDVEKFLLESSSDVERAKEIIFMYGEFDRRIYDYFRP